jgi:hypothetical protein
LLLLAGQHGCPALPHPQAPCLHVPYVKPPDAWQICPSPKQRPARQHPLPSHVLPSQHGSPGPPHTLQIPLSQTAPARQAGVVEQHDSPGSPHVTQVPPVLAVVEQLVCGALHELPQQLCPAAPQPVHWPALQVPYDIAPAPHVEPGARQVPP